jgi:hypothetical protein
MKLIAAAFVGAFLIATAGIGLADDHLFDATQAGGLIFDEDLDAVFNKNGQVIPESPGQGSPFTGEHQCTPATDTGAAQDNANVKPKGVDDIDECTE